MELDLGVNVHVWNYVVANWVWVSIQVHCNVHVLASLLLQAIDAVEIPEQEKTYRVYKDSQSGPDQEAIRHMRTHHQAHGRVNMRVPTCVDLHAPARCHSGKENKTRRKQQKQTMLLRHVVSCRVSIVNGYGSKNSIWQLRKYSLPVVPLLVSTLILT